MFIKKEKNNFIYKDIYQYPTTVMLNITDNCNLMCKYCFVEQHPHFMDINTAKQAIDWIANNYKEKRKKLNILSSEKCTLNFFGGEPLLLYDSIIVPLVLYIEETYPNIFDLGITTNCTLLNHKRIDFLAEHFSGILCSIDGAEQTQCYNRPCRNNDNSSKLIEKNIKYLIQKMPQATARSTGYGPTINNLFNDYKYLENLGFHSYSLILDTRHKWTKQQKKNLEIEIKKIFYDQFSQLIKNKKIKMTANLFDLLSNINLLQDESEENSDECLRCGIGTITCAIGPDGKIYGCQQDVSQNKKNIFLIGNLQNGINKKLHTKLLKTYLKTINKLSYRKCKTCAAKKWCYNKHHICPSTNYYLSKKMHFTSKIMCFYTQLLYKLTLLNTYVLIKLEEERRDI